MQVPELYSSLIIIAKKDLRLSKIGASDDDPYIEGVCFHCQQCAEKVLKAFLSFNGIKFKYPHDLESLCEECEKIDSDFTNVDTICQILTHYSPNKRYINDGKIPTSEMFEAIELAEEVLNFVCKKIYQEES